ncbi:hypothetical protein CVT26_009428 [Gymnopilus dilepis]|uniref:Uncharacterized protein n=1 Tax=Gymnopilus dilepis TaxID=231916 RepID=A0A409WUN9_9AGAR|nr:hypothetical protein CVT26_009428 [Gymnopilus dilepis]
MVSQLISHLISHRSLLYDLDADVDIPSRGQGSVERIDARNQVFQDLPDKAEGTKLREGMAGGWRLGAAAASFNGELGQGLRRRGQPEPNPTAASRLPPREHQSRRCVANRREARDERTNARSGMPEGRFERGQVLRQRRQPEPSGAREPVQARYPPWTTIPELSPVDLATPLPQSMHGALARRIFAPSSLHPRNRQRR